MAVATENFSIREYTERMRSVDIRRCWPFGAGSEDPLTLPSISIRRYKWWTDEVYFAGSKTVDEEYFVAKPAAPETISEACGISGPSLPGMEVSMDLTDGEDVRPTGKGKQKMPKKRSMVELFAAAPLISGTVVDGEWDSDDQDCREEERKGGVRSKELEPGPSIRKNKWIKENNVVKKKGRKKLKKGLANGLKLEVRAWEKEKILKPKILSSVQSYMLQNALCKKINRKTAGSLIEMQKKTRKVKPVRKHRILQTSKLFSLNKEIAKKLPVRSILKKQNKAGKLVNAKAANFIKLYCESNKRVTFSVEDDILGSSRACTAMDIPRMQNLCKMFSDVLAASSALSHSNKGYDLAGIKDLPQDATSSESETHKTRESSTARKDLSTNMNSSNSSCSGTDKASFPVMVDLNRPIEANDFDEVIPTTSTLSSNCTYSGIPTSGGSNKNNQGSTSGVPSKVGLPLASEHIVLPTPHDNFVANSDATSSLTLLKDNEMQCRPNVYGQSEDHQSSKGLLSSLCPGETFIGLPLNSQGELIQFHSGTKLNEGYKKQIIDSCHKKHSEIMKKKVSGGASYQKNFYSTKERVRHWLNFTDLDGSKRMGIQKNQPVKCNSRFPGCSPTPKIHEYRNCADLQPKCNFDYHGLPAAQPTMRLMGKNVVVGGIGRDFPAFNDRRTPNNIETFFEQTRFSMFPSRSVPQQRVQREDVTATGGSKGHPLHVADSTPRFHHMNSFHPSFDCMHAHQFQWLSEKSENHVLPSQPFSSNCSPFLANFNSREGSVSSEHHYPAVGASRPQSIYQNIVPSSSHCRHNQRLFRRKLSSTSNPQFKSQDFESFSQPKPSAELPLWLLNAKEQTRNQIPDSHFSQLSSHLADGDVQRNSSMKNRDMTGTYSNLPCFKAPWDAHKLGERPTDFDDEIVIPAKRPPIGKELPLNFPLSASGNCIYGNGAGSSSSRFDNEFRSGPIKLIGGAKHILKPCQRTDAENCRPIHSTLICPATAASFGTEKKLSNIYKF